MSFLIAGSLVQNYKNFSSIFFFSRTNHRKTKQCKRKKNLHTFCFNNQLKERHKRQEKIAIQTKTVAAVFFPVKQF